jgi:hypothetical protein
MVQDLDHLSVAKQDGFHTSVSNVMFLLQLVKMVLNVQGIGSTISHRGLPAVCSHVEGSRRDTRVDVLGPRTAFDRVAYTRPSCRRGHAAADQS